MENGITHLRQYGPVNTAQLLAIIAHYGTCDNVVIPADAAETKWTGEKEAVGSQEYRSDFITAAIEHVTTCQAAQSKFAHLIDTSAVKEPVMTTTTDQPEPQPIPIAALNLSTDHLEGVILVVDHGGVTRKYDLLKVAERVPHMQFLRYDTARLTTVAPTESSEWELKEGQEVTLYAITGNGQYLIIGNDAYAYSDVKGLLDTHGHQLEIGATDYTPPAWAPAPQQERHVAGLSHEELGAQDGQLLHDRTPQSAYGTGLTELPEPEAPLVEDEDLDNVDGYSQDDMYVNRGLDWFWVTTPQAWAITILGFATGILTTTTITIHANHHFNLFWSVLIGLVAGVNATCGAGIISCLITGKYAEKPQFVTEEYEGQQILWTLGAILGWGVLCLVDLAFLF